MTKKTATKKKPIFASKRYKCLVVKQGSYTMVSTVIPAKELFALVKINRREDDRVKGYQRALDEGRTDSIAQFIDNGNAIPTNIVVALDKARIDSSGFLEIEICDDAGWVIDGQHRLGGAHEARSDIDLTVTAFIGLSDEQKIHQFVTINKEAKKVPTSLYLDLLPDLKINDKNEGELSKLRAVDIANQLNALPVCPLYGRIASLQSPEKGQLSLTNFVRKVAPIVHLSKGFLKLRNEKEQRLIIDSYFKALKISFPDEFTHKDCIFFKTVGFGGVMNALEMVYDRTLKRTGKSFKPEDVAETLGLASEFSFMKWRQYGTGSAAEIAAGKSLVDAINAASLADGKEDTLEF